LGKAGEKMEKMKRTTTLKMKKIRNNLGGKEERSISRRNN